MYDFRKFFIDGAWVSPAGRRELDVINPATEAVGRQDPARHGRGRRRGGQGGARGVRNLLADLARRAHRAARAHHQRLQGAHAATRARDLRRDGRADEAGAAMRRRAAASVISLTTLAVLKDFEFEEQLGTTQVRREPIGVCGLITPWNWPINQISCKVAPALAAGCTVVLKPSEIAPLSAHVFAEILAEAGVPKGVFNLVDGDGPTVGEAISRHPDIDMVSFTGSTRAGVLVAKAAADTVKRVSQELGGKSANIILEDADLNAAVKSGVLSMMSNTGQSCNAPSRMLVPAEAVRRSGEDREGGGREAGRRRSEGGRRDDGSGREQDAVREDPAADAEGHRGRRDRRHRRAGPAGRPRQGLLRQADRVRERQQRHDDRARRDLRAGAGDDSVPRRRRSDPHRQRHGLRTVGLRVLGQHRERAPRRAPSCAPAWCT